MTCLAKGQPFRRLVSNGHEIIPIDPRISRLGGGTARQLPARPMSCNCRDSRATARRAMQFQVQIDRRRRRHAGSRPQPIVPRDDPRLPRQRPPVVARRAHQDLCRRELATRFHADAVLYVAIHVYTVHFFQDQAKWDGVSESIGNAVPVWVAALAGTYSSGTVPALSLCVTLRDIDGNNLYTECGGIQLAAKLAGHTFQKVSDEKILTDAQRNTNAVAIAFKAFHDEEPAARHH